MDFYYLQTFPKLPSNSLLKISSPFSKDKEKGSPVSSTLNKRSFNSNLDPLEENSSNVEKILFAHFIMKNIRTCVLFSGHRLKTIKKLSKSSLRSQGISLLHKQFECRLRRLIGSLKLKEKM